MRSHRRRLHHRLSIATMAVLLVLSSTAVQAQESADLTQNDIRARHGAPEAFAILYFDEPAPDGTPAATSAEQWSYLNDGVEFTFVGDEVVGLETIEIRGAAEAAPVPYDPDDFRAYMSLDEVLAAAGLEDYLGGPVNRLVEGGELFFADRLSWGLQDGELRYIEAFALEAGPVAGASE